MEIGKKIKSLRVESGFTQQDMAAKLNVSDNTYRNIENDKISPSINTLEMIADILKKPFTSLVVENKTSIIKNNEKQVKCSQYCAFIYVPEKAVIRYENMLKEKNDYISLLKNKINILENTINKKIR
jgi:transcriptional regulator with XRE-family HTH domain